MKGYDRTSDIKTLREFIAMQKNTADQIFRKFATLPGAISGGTAPARFVYVPGSRPDRVVLVAHADTVWTAGTFSSSVYTAQGTGADDRAGCAILWLMRDSGHSLLVTDGEERGLLGATALTRSTDIYNEVNGHRFMVEFDRRGAKDFKCYGVGTDEFRKYVSEMMPGYSEPDRNSATDICVLCRDICGVNLSVGYYGEHTPRERMNESEWHDTLTAARKWLNAPLPVRFERRRQLFEIETA